MLGISNAIATEQIKNGYITGLKSDELDMQAYKLLEQYYTPEQLAFMTGDVLDERLEEAKIACLTTGLALGSFKGEHLRSIDAFNFGKDVAVTSLQLIVLAIAISNPGTALAGGAYVVNGGVGIADGAIRIDQGDTFNGAMEMSLSFLEVGGGLKLVSETTSLGKYVDEFIRDNRGCVGARKALEGGNASGKIDYKKVFFDEYPELEGKVVVHHSVEQQVLTKPQTKGLFSYEEMHSLDNLRGIPKDINSDLHLSKICKEWNRFYKEVSNPTKQQLLNKAAEIDSKYGHLFNPPLN